ncbi:MAG TPA: substrate-binding domain-containing protein [Burkholderiaceae bacterium]|nr:substrate-binding domain-containing protein [Burkholderiaceae bacterium]
MHRSSGIIAVELQYALSSVAGAHLHNPFFDVLGALRTEGSIAAAARRLDWSYRHLWGYLKEQESRLGRPLIHWDKGRAARLTDFAEKLLWAETRIRARLAPQVENLATEIGRELSIAFNDDVQITTCVASHDLSLPLLKRLCQTEAEVLLDLHYEGSIDALRRMRAGHCAFAGIHLPLSQPALARRGSKVHQAFGPLLRLGKEKLIRVAHRTQGLFVARGNPLGVRGVEDLPRLRFVNRAPGTGTRALIEELLASQRIDPATVPGFERVESNHLSVATAVAAGEADAGIGIQAAAAGKGIDFIPLLVEDYFLVCERETLNTPCAEAIVELLASPLWRQQVELLAGYSAHDSGEIISLRRTLPWYR